MNALKDVVARHWRDPVRALVVAHSCRRRCDDELLSCPVYGALVSVENIGVNRISSCVATPMSGRSDRRDPIGLCLRGAGCDTKRIWPLCTVLGF